MIEGIEFDAKTGQLVADFIEKLKLLGDLAIYSLPKMWKGKGEIRLAHHGPDLQHPKGRGVFAQIRPTLLGATLIRNKKDGEGNIPLNEHTLDVAYTVIASIREQKKDRVKGNETVDPNKPGTVQGGQFESKRREH
jgi:hypothetical protein